MIFEEVVNAYIKNYRDAARHETSRFRNMKTTEAIRAAALCETEDGKRHSHQYRIPRATLELAEAKLQAIRRSLAKAAEFATLHALVHEQVGGMKGVGDLLVYDIAQRIGAHFGIEPKQVYSHRGTRTGARALGISGDLFDPKVLPKAFARLSPAEIEDCLCIYKADLLDHKSLVSGPDSGCAASRKRRHC